MRKHEAPRSGTRRPRETLTSGARYPRPRREDETAARRRFLSLIEGDLDLDFVRAEAGERRLTPEEAERHAEVRRRRGRHLYADMLFVLTHQTWPAEQARRLWSSIVDHRAVMERDLGRGVAITVATLDYLDRGPSRPQLLLCPEEELAGLATAATTDGLTGLLDHAAFKGRLEAEVQRLRRYRTPLSLLLLDLDRFKALNDTHGHPAGDRVLATVGRLIRDEVRATDVAARYGGEEFGLLLPHTPGADARALGERLRLRIREHFAPDLPVTVSVGVAECSAEEGPEALLAAADVALYQAKREGRDRTVLAGPPAAPSGSPRDPALR